jgi:hypothetical protein
MWHALAGRQRLRLLLIQRRPEPAHRAAALPAQALLARLAAWAQADAPPPPHG